MAGVKQRNIHLGIRPQGEIMRKGCNRPSDTPQEFGVGGTVNNKKTVKKTWLLKKPNKLRNDV